MNYSCNISFGNSNFVKEIQNFCPVFTTAWFLGVYLQAEKEAVLFDERSGAFLIEKRRFSGREAPLFQNPS
ncbi:MAG: hypothetical protein IJ176_04480 [Prevotella sp.]|nr:hypothetical protein [Prevotella sp.]